MYNKQQVKLVLQIKPLEFFSPVAVVDSGFVHFANEVDKQRSNLSSDNIVPFRPRPLPQVVVPGRRHQLTELRVHPVALHVVFLVHYLRRGVDSLHRTDQVRDESMCSRVDRRRHQLVVDELAQQLDRQTVADAVRVAKEPTRRGHVRFEPESQPRLQVLQHTRVVLGHVGGVVPVGVGNVRHELAEVDVGSIGPVDGVRVLGAAAFLRRSLADSLINDLKLTQHALGPVTWDCVAVFHRAQWGSQQKQNKHADHRYEAEIDFQLAA